jgi:D-glycero-D-manno-heptose 1,7-bisphosphate phosphatase
MNKIKLVMLDRDGTLNKRIPDNYLVKEKDILWPADFNDLLKIINSDIKISVVSNQACVSKKLISYSDVISLTKSVISPLFEIDEKSIFICTHQEIENCFCRKPKPGLILKSLEYFKISSGDSVFIGDSEKDAEAASAANVRFIGVCWNSKCLGQKCVHSLSSAVDIILS